MRPVRQFYTHVGHPGPKYPLVDLTEDQMERYGQYGYVKWEAYPESEGSVLGKYWTQEQLDSIGKGCGVETKMNLTIAETYAREPHFYGATYCVGCGMHRPVGENGEFVWSDTDERVGT